MIIRWIAMVLTLLALCGLQQETALTFVLGFVLSYALLGERPKKNEDNESDNSIGKKTWH